MMNEHIARVSFFVRQGSMLSVLFLCTVCLLLPISSSGDVVFLNGFEAVAEFTQQAYVKASNTDSQNDHCDMFGISVAISGNTMAVGASGESSNATGINNDQADNSMMSAGAVYEFNKP